MSEEIKVIKRLLLYAIALLVCAVLININSEGMIIKLDSVLISNTLLLTLMGGVFTGIIAVLIEKIYLYRLHKNSAKEWLYRKASMLYAEIYYWHCNIRELQEDRTKEVPKNLFSNKVNMVKGILMDIVNTDYAVFWENDSLMLMHTRFRSRDWQTLNNIFDKSIYLDISITTVDLEYNKQKKKLIEKEREELKQDFCYTISKELEIEKDTSLIYETLVGYDRYLKVAMDILDKYLNVLQKDDPKKCDWEGYKRTIHMGYIGIYSSNIDEFLQKSKSLEI